jgi:lipoyl(octanoyl) transferase
MMIKVNFQDLGLIDYKECWDYQTRLFNNIMNTKTGKQEELSTINYQLSTKNYLLFCEHPHVYTLGKSGSEGNLLIDLLKLKNINAAYYRIDRGGDITYHGPGQIVGYPILDLEKFNLGIKTYIWSLEESIILTLADYEIKAGRLEGATGVWLNTMNNEQLFANAHENANAKLTMNNEKRITNNEQRTTNLRKICAIGVRTSRFVSMHGFAFNVNTDLSYFNHINPCGFTDKSVTSMEKELGEKQNIEEVKTKLKAKIAEVFGMELI